MSSKSCVYGNSKSAPLLCLKHLRTLINPHARIFNISRFLNFEFTNRKRLTSEISLVYINISHTNNTISTYFLSLLRNVDISWHQLFAVNFLYFSISHYFNFARFLCNCLNFFITDVQHDVVDSSSYKRENEKCNCKRGISLNKKYKAEEILQ